MANRKKEQNRYRAIIEAIFIRKFKEGETEVLFSRDDFIQMAQQLYIHWTNLLFTAKPSSDNGN
jgi:hypothetical protein